MEIMKQFLVDADIVINHLKGRSRRGFGLGDLLNQGLLHISSVTVAEIWSGLPAEQKRKVEKILDQMERLGVPVELGKLAGSLVYSHARRGIRVTTIDAIVAAMSQANRLILVSHDKVFAKIKGLKLYSPAGILNE